MCVVMAVSTSPVLRTHRTLPLQATGSGASSRRMVLPGGSHRWELAAGSGQDAHKVAAHALDVRGADHAGPFGFELGVDPLDAAQQFPPSCGQVYRPLAPIARVRGAREVPTSHHRLHEL